jgi:flagellar assembly protein FliH
MPSQWADDIMATAEPTRILKAEVMRELRAPVAFNYDDFRRRCDEYADKVRRETQQLIEEARREAAEIRKRGLEEGKKEGRSHGLSAAKSEIDQQARELSERLASEKLQTALPALQAAADAVVRERERWLAHWESIALKLSIAIASKLVRRELETRPETSSKMLGEVFALAAGSERIKVRMHPRDAEHLGARAHEAVCALAACGEAELALDETITPGGCIIETQQGVIDARMETQLERIASELI